jgi:branched-chain amino acid transport system permease protein
VSLPFVLIQLLNGVQYGLLLFLIASGLTLTLGIMGIVNVAHGSFYMIGAYLAYAISARTGSLVVALAVGVPLTIILGVVLEWLLLSRLYRRDHLQQLLITYGLILVFEELRSILAGDDVHGVAVPALLAASIPLTENQSYPIYRLVMSLACLLLASGLYILIHKTRLGMVIRACNSNREMAQTLGVNVGLVYRLIFGLGVGLAAFAGLLAAPVSSVFPGMGNQVLILCFVVVILGGIGSVWGAMVAALGIGLADTLGKVLLPDLAGLAIYVPMAAILLWRPEGLARRT